MKTNLFEKRTSDKKNSVNYVLYKITCHISTIFLRLNITNNFHINGVISYLLRDNNHSDVIRKIVPAAIASIHCDSSYKNQHHMILLVLLKTKCMDQWTSLGFHPLIAISSVKAITIYFYMQRGNRFYIVPVL